MFLLRYLSFIILFLYYFSNSSATELKISESCLRRLKEMKKDGSFLRVSVDGGGCSGFQYKFSLDKEKQQDDM